MMTLVLTYFNTISFTTFTFSCWAKSLTTASALVDLALYDVNRIRNITFIQSFSKIIKMKTPIHYTSANNRSLNDQLSATQPRILWPSQLFIEIIFTFVLVSVMCKELLIRVFGLFSDYLRVTPYKAVSFRYGFPFLGYCILIYPILLVRSSSVYDCKYSTKQFISQDINCTHGIFSFCNPAIIILF